MKKKIRTKKIFKKFQVFSKGKFLAWTSHPPTLFGHIANKSTKQMSNIIENINIIENMWKNIKVGCVCMGK